MSAHRLPLALAVVCTASGVVMSAAAAAERGTTALDVGLVMSWAVILGLGAHLLPALFQRLPRAWQGAAWLVWVGCVLATLYSHTHYMHAAAQRAGAARAAAVASGSAESRALQADLSATQARPVAQVAADKAKAEGTSAKAAAALAQCKRRPDARCDQAQAAATAASATVAALVVELAEAQRAAAMRDELRTSAAQADAARTAAKADPVDAAIAQALGLRTDGVSLLLAVAQSLLLDVLAALLWRMALPAEREERITPVVAAEAATPNGVTQARCAAVVMPGDAVVAEPPAQGWWRPSGLRVRPAARARDRPLDDIHLMPV